MTNSFTPEQLIRMQKEFIKLQKGSFLVQNKKASINQQKLKSTSARRVSPKISSDATHLGQQIFYDKAQVQKNPQKLKDYNGKYLMSQDQRFVTCPRQEKNQYRCQVDTPIINQDPSNIEQFYVQEIQRANDLAKSQFLEVQIKNNQLFKTLEQLEKERLSTSALTKQVQQLQSQKQDSQDFGVAQQLIVENQSLKLQLQKVISQTENGGLSIELIKIQEQNQKLQGVVKQLQTEKALLTDQLQRMNTNLLHSEALLQESRNMLETSRDSPLSSYTETNSRILESQSLQVSQKSLSVGQLWLSINQLEKEKLALSDQVKLLQQQKSNDQSKIIAGGINCLGQQVSAEQLVVSLDDKDQSSIAEIGELKLQNRRVIRQNNEQLVLLSSRNQVIRDLYKKNEELQQELSETEKQLEDLQQKNQKQTSQLQQELHTVQKNAEFDIKIRNQELSALRSQRSDDDTIAYLVRQLSEQTNKKEDVIKENSHLQEQIQLLHKNITVMKMKLEKSELQRPRRDQADISQIQSLLSDKGALQSKYESLLEFSKTQIQTLQWQHQLTRQQFAQFEQQFDSAQSQQVRVCKQKITQLISVIKALKAKLQKVEWKAENATTPQLQLPDFSRDKLQLRNELSAIAAKREKQLQEERETRGKVLKLQQQIQAYQTQQAQKLELVAQFMTQMRGEVGRLQDNLPSKTPTSETKQKKAPSPPKAPLHSHVSEPKFAHYGRKSRSDSRRSSEESRKVEETTIHDQNYNLLNEKSQPDDTFQMYAPEVADTNSFKQAESRPVRQVKPQSGETSRQSDDFFQKFQDNDIQVEERRSSSASRTVQEPFTEQEFLRLSVVDQIIQNFAEDANNTDKAVILVENFVAKYNGHIKVMATKTNTIPFLNSAIQLFREFNDVLVFHSQNPMVFQYVLKLQQFADQLLTGRRAMELLLSVVDIPDLRPFVKEQLLQVVTYIDPIALSRAVCVKMLNSWSKHTELRFLAFINDNVSVIRNEIERIQDFVVYEGNLTSPIFKQWNAISSGEKLLQIFVALRFMGFRLNEEISKICQKQPLSNFNARTIGGSYLKLHNFFLGLQGGKHNFCCIAPLETKQGAILKVEVLSVEI